MAADTPPQEGWTRIGSPTGRYEYQFQGRVPTVREARYLDAADYQFLVLDEGGWLYRIPVRVAADAEEELKKGGDAEVVRIAEAQLRAGLGEVRPRHNAPYPELDSHFAVDLKRARELAGSA
jgi:hypothetical protein